MTTFGLIPGACHGAWGWERMVPALADNGHRGVAIDLPCDDASAGFERYVDVTLSALDPGDDDVVLVGHSLGAHTAVRAARARAIRGIVFVSGVIPPRAGERNDEEPPMEAPGAFDVSRSMSRGGSGSPIRPTRSAPSTTTATRQPPAGQPRCCASSRERLTPSSASPSALPRARACRSSAPRIAWRVRRGDDGPLGSDSSTFPSSSSRGPIRRSCHDRSTLRRPSKTHSQAFEATGSTSWG